ncbi:MAG: flagellar export chaperone FliS [Leptospiraceae bacterium]|nr:flagellar export chaperone FliS [Leptospiraceae bacterium]MDW7975013.1 flagellar export chaperone FliS [Leptospiraceae bacterium]
MYDSYKDTEILTADQGKLILMLYDGAIRFLNVAIDNMDFRKYDIVNNNIIKAQDIITELMLSLNLEEGGEIARNLFNIYAYLKKRLLEGNIKKDIEILKEVIYHLTTLRSAWEEAAKKTSTKTNPVTSERKISASFSITG